MLNNSIQHIKFENIPMDLSSVCLRKYTLCNTNAVGDEFHYVFEWYAFDCDSELYLTFKGKCKMYFVLEIY